ncbi:PRC-barrel domain containing protein [Streptomyces sp. NPDC051180]|uniref:PRC-barrel domain containing protein n=1 Tax=Streptomyces sp. NPDC051180 TaxID=3155797 RepID=UPI00344F8542
MTHDIWTYGETTAHAAHLDLTGYSVEATDGPVGKVALHEAEAGRSHVVVDTEPWLPDRRVILPAGVVTSVDARAESLRVNCSRAQIEAAPSFEPGPDQPHDDGPHRMRLLDYYLAFFR